jgi:hypothetical protein
MTIKALRVEPDGTVYELALSEGAQDRRRAVRAAIGGPVDLGSYHRRALFHLHGDGVREGKPLNPAAWALAAVWLGRQLPYGLYGTVVVTGHDGQGGIEALDVDMADGVARGCEAVREVLAGWAMRAPSPADVSRDLVAAVEPSGVSAVDGRR